MLTVPFNHSSSRYDYLASTRMESKEEKRPTQISLPKICQGIYTFFFILFFIHI